MAGMPLDNKKNNLTLIAYSKIKDAIMHNRLRPGYIISGSQIAKKLNMSRTPIREAVQILAQEDLVEIRKGSGFCVKSITFDELREISEVRTALECTALHTAIKLVSTEVIEDLIRRWDAVYRFTEENADAAPIRKIVELDNETHQLIVLHCNNHYLIHLMEQITLRITRVQFLSVNHENALYTIDQHTDILHALRRKDIQLAEQLLRKHLQYSLTFTQENEDDFSSVLNVSNYLDAVFDGE